MLSLFKNHNMMMPCVDDYVYDDPTLAKNSSGESFGFGSIVHPEMLKIAPAQTKDIKATMTATTTALTASPFGTKTSIKKEKECDEDALDCDAILAEVYNPMKQGGIKGMEKGSLAHMRNKYAVSPFKMKSPKTVKKTLNVNALSFDPSALNPNATAFNPLDVVSSDTHTDISSVAIIEEEDELMDEEEEDGMAYGSPFGESSSSSTRKEPNYNNDATILALHGFRKIKKMEDSLQGKIYLGETIVGHESLQSQGLKKKKKSKRVVIKKTYKSLHNQRETQMDGMNIVVDENIVKEAIILHHLTVDNKPAGSAICKLLAFFESAKAYYIVMEVAGTQTLKEFVDRAHEYIRAGKLKVAHWKKICKYVSWQIAATLYWMHTDMNCAHLDLTLENIMISNGNFDIAEDGQVTIDRNLSCKIIDFGLAEIFNAPCDKKQYFKFDFDENIVGPFHLNNKYQIATNCHQCPEIFDEEVYDGRKADMWSFGVLLFYMHFGMYPYERQLAGEDEGFASLKNGEMRSYLDETLNLGHLFNNKLITLITACLCVDETKRFNVENVVTHSWFNTYFKRYAAKIKEQSAEQLKKNQSDKHKMNQNIPYYEPHKNI